MNDDIEALRKTKDNAYWERNQLVAALSKVFPSHLAKHPDTDKDWEDDWRNIVVINMPSEDAEPDINGKRTYQLTWHIHDHDLPMFDHLRFKEYWWDGHTTEEKYRRLRTLNPDMLSSPNGRRAA